MPSVDKLRQERYNRSKKSATAHGIAATACLEEDEDPSADIPAGVLANVRAACCRVFSAQRDDSPRVAAPLTCEEVHEAMVHATPAEREQFFDILTEETYDTPALTRATGILDPEARDVDADVGVVLSSQELDTYSALLKYFKTWFARFATGGFDEASLAAFLKELPLECMASKATCTAVRRVSACSGLPPDGHALHACVQGKIVYYHFGADRQVTLAPIPHTDSTWSLPSHRASVFIIGDSAAGKDTVISILKTLDLAIATEPALCGAPFRNTLVVGKPTYRGILAALEKGRTQDGTCCLQWYNSELKACIGPDKGMLQEEHLCQLAEGTPIGCRNKEDDILVKPNAWFAIGAQIEAIVERFGSTDNGRLRALAVWLSGRESMQVPFFNKFLKRSLSLQHLANLLLAVARRQQGPHPVTLENTYAPATFAVHAAMHDAAKTLLSHPDAPGSVIASIVKLVGKAFGSLAAANCAVRNAEWAICPALALPPDPVIRFEDALAAATQLLKHIATQVFVETAISRLPPRQWATAATSPSAALGASPTFTPLHNAARKLLDFLGEHAEYRVSIVEHGLYRHVSEHRPGGRTLKTLRGVCFARGKPADGYGGKGAYEAYSKADGWRALLAFLLERGLAAEDDSAGEGPKVVRFLAAAEMPQAQREMLLTWHLKPGTLKWLLDLSAEPAAA